MPPIYWIIGLIAFGILFWRTLKSNGMRGKTKTGRHVETTELARENYRLRHVLAQMSVENYALKCRPPDHW